MATAGRRRSCDEGSPTGPATLSRTTWVAPERPTRRGRCPPDGAAEADEGAVEVSTRGEEGQPSPDAGLGFDDGRTQRPGDELLALTPAPMPRAAFCWWAWRRGAGQGETGRRCRSGLVAGPEGPGKELLPRRRPRPVHGNAPPASPPGRGRR